MSSVRSDLMKGRANWILYVFLSLLVLFLFLFQPSTHTSSQYVVNSLIRSLNLATRQTPKPSRLSVLYVVGHDDFTQSALTMRFFDRHPEAEIDVSVNKPIRTVAPHVCLCIKLTCPPDIFAACRQHNASLVLDLLDNRILEFFNQSAADVLNAYDMILVNNNHVRDWLSTRLAGSVQVVRLYHQHSNLNRSRSVFAEHSDTRAHPTKVLMIGAEENLPDQKQQQVMREEFAKHGLSVEVQAKMPSVKLFDWEAAVCNQLKHHHSSASWSASLGLIWPRGDGVFELQFRPVTRLVTAWSHGLLTAFYPFQSYLEVCELALNVARNDTAYLRQFASPDCKQLGLSRTLDEVVEFFGWVRGSSVEQREVVVRVLMGVAEEYFSFEVVSLQLASILHSVRNKQSSRTDNKQAVMSFSKNKHEDALTLSHSIQNISLLPWWERSLFLTPTTTTTVFSKNDCKVPLELRSAVKQAAEITRTCALVFYTTAFFPTHKIPKDPNELIKIPSSSSSTVSHNRTSCPNVGNVCYVLFAGKESFEHFSQRNSTHSVWHIIPVDLSASASGSRLSHFFKLLPHLIFPSRYTFYVDFKLQLTHDVCSVISKVLHNSESSFLAPAHLCRDPLSKLQRCVNHRYNYVSGSGGEYDEDWLLVEAFVVSRDHTRVANLTQLDEQVKRYSALLKPPVSLSYAKYYIQDSLILRDAHSKEAAELSCAWFQELSRPDSSDGDQMSFAYTAATMPLLTVCALGITTPDIAFAWVAKS